jgi:hypothetical protein
VAAAASASPTAHQQGRPERPQPERRVRQFVGIAERQRPGLRPVLDHPAGGGQAALDQTVPDRRLGQAQVDPALGVDLEQQLLAAGAVALDPGHPRGADQRLGQPAGRGVDRAGPLRPLGPGYGQQQRGGLAPVQRHEERPDAGGQPGGRARHPVAHPRQEWGGGAAGFVQLGLEDREPRPDVGPDHPDRGIGRQRRLDRDRDRGLDLRHRVPGPGGDDDRDPGLDRGVLAVRHVQEGPSPGRQAEAEEGPRQPPPLGEEARQAGAGRQGFAEHPRQHTDSER